tara:strand:- start:176 stop:682 length:507 start_codon:yes stop_codon:yes gene_type:complete
MVTKKRDSRRPKSRGKNIPQKSDKGNCCPIGGFDYKAVGLLKKYISETGKIDSGRRNGNCAKCQRGLTTAVKRARHMALLPFASNHNYDTSLLNIEKKEPENISDDTTEKVVDSESENENIQPEQSSEFGDEDQKEDETTEDDQAEDNVDQIESVDEVSDDGDQEKSS